MLQHTRRGIMSVYHVANAALSPLVAHLQEPRLTHVTGTTCEDGYLLANIGW